MPGDTDEPGQRGGSPNLYPTTGQDSPKRENTWAERRKEQGRLLFLLQNYEDHGDAPEASESQRPPVRGVL